MQTKTFILDVINRDESFDSTSFNSVPQLEFWLWVRG